MIIDNPKDIYSHIKVEVEQILANIGENNNSDLKVQKNNSIGTLNKIKKNIDDSLNALEKNAEWNKFVIAFYGETNAGKSSIIETLRIVLNEPTKIENQKIYLAKLEQYFSEPNSENESLDEKLYQRIQENNKAQKSAEEQIPALLEKVKNIKSNMPFHLKIIHFFISLAEEKEIKKIKAEIIKFKKEKDELEKLKKYADGEIIGDGRSDFTQKNKEFNFKIDNQEFILVDVPGIEGKEETVIKPIFEAVQKAHAVFYVTPKATPPQTGDKEKNQKGTLEKIKEHLGAQTEVWSIFNKRITNPRQLKETLISENENEALTGEEGLNSRMQNVLKPNYQGVISLSIYPAFLAASHCVGIHPKHSEMQAKFLQKYDRKELIIKSGLDNFIQKLRKITKNSKEKIEKSNYNKTNIFLIASINDVEEIKNQFSEAKKEISKKVNSLKDTIDRNVESLKEDLEESGRIIVREFKSDVSKDVYKKIDEDIDDEFKNYLNDKIESVGNELEDNLKEKFEFHYNTFNKETEKDIEHHNKKIKELAEDILNKNPNDNLLDGFNLSIDIDSGIDSTSLIASLVGGVLLAFTPAGWFVIALGAVGVVLGVVKSLWNVIDPEYKMSQQKKETDKNLRKVCQVVNDKIENSIEKQIDNLKNGLEKKLYKDLNKPIEDLEKLEEEIGTSIDKLKELSKTITQRI